MKKMKGWIGKDICSECAATLGASLNIGRQCKGRCQRCHSEQTLFRVIEVTGHDEDACLQCAHPPGTHAASCSRVDLRSLYREHEEIVKILQETGGYDPQKSLPEQLRKILRQVRKNDQGGPAG